MAKAIKVIGILDNGKESLPPLYQQWIEESDVLVGGERHLRFFPEYSGEKIVIKGGLSLLVDQLKQETRNVVILASGDPLFHGIGGYLAGKLPVDLYPNMSSIQLAFAKIKEQWQDAKLYSVHGRQMKGLAQKMNGEKRVALLTDHKNSPNTIANYLLSFGMTEYRAFVAENLGNENERYGWYSLEEMKETRFSPLNVVILKQIETSPLWPLGIQDEEFLQRKPDKGLITKREIRVLSLANLQLKETSIMWDIGTCTGSVAIEAAKIARFGAIYAIEKNEADLANCYENMKKFRTDFTAVCGKAPERLDEFPDPDAVFMGGTGGNLRELVAYCVKRLKKNGRIVINAVTIETLSLASNVLKEYGFSVDITLAQLSRSKPILHMTRFESLNPIYLITATKEENNE